MRLVDRGESREYDAGHHEVHGEEQIRQIERPLQGFKASR
jgi:hypothetical protein